MSTASTKYSKIVDLATYGFIRREYQGGEAYPIAVMNITMCFINRIRERWNPQQPHCTALSKCDGDKTGTHICPVRGHMTRSPLPTLYSLLFGSIMGSTKGGHHQWAIKINGYGDRIMIGICNEGIYGESIQRYYGMEFYKPSNHSQSFRAFTIKARRYSSAVGLAEDHERLENGDVVIIQLRGCTVHNRVIRGNQKIQTRFKIVEGDYRVVVGLNQIGDSVSMVGYQQTDKVPKCNGKWGSGWCSQEIRNGWKYCPVCSTKT